MYLIVIYAKRPSLLVFSFTVIEMSVSRFAIELKVTVSRLGFFNMDMTQDGNMFIRLPTLSHDVSVSFTV